MARPIGYYVHHHGDGHRQRALAIAAHAGGRMTLLGTGLAGRTGDVPAVDLPDDRLPAGGFDGNDDAHRPDALHYAPIDHDGIRRRVAAVTTWIASARPALIVVDVSVEIAMLARLASVPTVYVRLGGGRGDPAHIEAFRGAIALLAPFHALLDDPGVPDTVRAATFYAPGLSARPPVVTIDERLVLGVVGRGGGLADGERWADAARATPGYRWRVIGPCTTAADPPPNLKLGGWIDDPARAIASAAIVVGGAGDGLLGNVVASAKRFVCIPEPRPFDEQHAKAARLQALGAAVVVPAWPDASRWPALLAEAAGLDPSRLRQLDDIDGCARAAAALIAIADGERGRRRISA